MKKIKLLIKLLSYLFIFLINTSYAQPFHPISQANNVNLLRISLAKRLDKAEKKLRLNLAGADIDIIRSKKSIRLIIPSFLIFNTHHYIIKKTFKPILLMITQSLRAFPKALFVIASDAKYSTHRKIAKLRTDRQARAIAYFFKKDHIAGKQLLSIGFGTDRHIQYNQISITLYPPI